MVKEECQELLLRIPVVEERDALQALGLAFDFEWSNRNLFFDQYTRTQSYFDNSELAAKGLPEPTGAEKAAFAAKMGEINRAVGPAMLSMMVGTQQNAEGHAMGEIIDRVKNDSEMTQALDGIKAIYGN